MERDAFEPCAVSLLMPYPCLQVLLLAVTEDWQECELSRQQQSPRHLLVRDRVPSYLPIEQHGSTAAAETLCFGRRWTTFACRTATLSRAL